MYLNIIWTPQSLSELTPILFNMELTHLGSNVSKYIQNFFYISFDLLCTISLNSSLLKVSFFVLRNITLTTSFFLLKAILDLSIEDLHGIRNKLRENN